MRDRVYTTIATKNSWEDVLIIDNNCRKDLLWWKNAIQNWNGAPVLVKQPQIQLETDALGFGWDGLCREYKPLKTLLEGESCRC